MKRKELTKIFVMLKLKKLVWSPMFIHKYFSVVWDSDGYSRLNVQLFSPSLFSCQNDTMKIVENGHSYQLSINTRREYLLTSHISRYYFLTFQSRIAL